jgi:hypothetical protein
MIGVEPEDDERPQAWRWIGGLAAVAVVAAGVGLVIARPWQSDSTGPGSTVPPAQLTSRLLLGEPPGDLELSAAQPASPRDAPASDDVVVEFPEDVSLVAWVEGGQLIVLSGTFAPGELVRAGQSVRAASAEEWAEIEQLGPLPGLDNVGG